MSIHDDKLNGGDYDDGCFTVVAVCFTVIFSIMLYLVTFI